MPRPAKLQTQSTPNGSAQIEEAVSFLRQSYAYQLEYIQTLMDSVTLAAEQVQDKRLEILELGPEVSATDVLLDFLITFVLESPLTSKIINGAIKKIFLPRVNSHTLACEKALKLKNESINVRRSQLSKLGTDPYDSLRKSLSDQIHESSFLSGRISELNSVAKFLSEQTGIGDTAIAYAKAVREAAKNPSTKPQTLNATDTPGVLIRSLAQTYVSNQRLTIQMEQSMFEFWLRTGLITSQELYERLKGKEDTSSNRMTLEELKDHSKRYFESVIWALLYHGRSFTGKHATSEPKYRFTSSVMKECVQPSLLQYWLRRFINPKTNSPFSDIKPLQTQGKGTKFPIDEATPALAAYMWAVVEEAQKNKASLMSSGPLQPRESLLTQ